MQSVDYFSIKIPGIPFPYPTMTIFNGARKTGMAYPMIVNDYDTPGNNGAIMVTSREIVHTYFPFYVGVNEQKYAWMDEGWATSLPADFQFYFGHVDPRIWDAKAYEYYAGDEMEMPVMIPSELLRGGSFGLASYLRAGEAFLFLRNMLGNKLFKKVLDTFIQRWHGKHPIPYDLFFTFNNVTNENLDWYWKSWFFEPGYPDLGIKSVKIDSSKAIVTVERIGSIPVPVYLRVTFESGTIDTVYRTAKVWKDGKKEISFKITFLPQKKIGSIRLGVPAIPDVNRKNNYFLNQPKPYKMPETNKKKGTKKKKKKKKTPEETFEQQIAKVLVSKKRTFDASSPVSISEIDLVRQQIGKCWNVPAGAKNAENINIEIAINMNPDGTVLKATVNNKGLDADPFLRTMAESAIRAVMRCQPFQLPRNKYNRWKTMTLIFNPKEMFGG